MIYTMTIYLISGPTGAGKNTVADEMAKHLERVAIIDFDAIRNMFAKPHNTPWEDEAGKHQNDLTIELVCYIAQTMAEDGRTPIILDVLSDENAKQYRKRLGSELKIYQLSPSWETVAERNRVRAEKEGRIRLTAEQLKMVFDSQQAFTDYDERINNGNQTPANTAEEILN